jgi:hypothetical protein
LSGHLSMALRKGFVRQVSLGIGARLIGKAAEVAGGLEVLDTRIKPGYVAHTTESTMPMRCHPVEVKSPHLGPPVR